MSVGGDESFAELPSQKEQRACRHRQAKKNRQASFELNFRLPGPVAIHGGKLFKVRGQVARFADRPPTQSDPARGASRPGRWRLLGRSGAWVVRNSAGGLAVVGDHTDLLGTLGAAIHDLLTDER